MAREIKPSDPPWAVILPNGRVSCRNIRDAGSGSYGTGSVYEEELLAQFTLDEITVLARFTFGPNKNSDPEASKIPCGRGVPVACRRHLAKLRRNFFKSVFEVDE